jgi:hypothetical protein
MALVVIPGNSTHAYALGAIVGLCEIGTAPVADLYIREPLSDL